MTPRRGASVWRFVSWRGRRVGLLLAFTALASACAHFPVNPPLGHWEPRPPNTFSHAERPNDTLILLAFSGGGTRAAAFAYGVLEELRDTRVLIAGRPRRLLDEVELVSGVSGGSFVAAYYGLYGDRIFQDFEQRFLRHNVQRDLILAMFNPVNWVRLLSPFYSRSDLASAYYDRQIFDGATFADLAHGPGIEVVINATDMVRGSRFSFRQPAFDFLCADLAPIHIARAVAASAAVPGPLTPVILQSYAGTCGFEPPAWIEQARADREGSRRRLRQAEILHSYLDPTHEYVYLLDGGISDNLGVRLFLERTTEAGNVQQALEGFGAANVRQVLLIAVNAETDPDLSRREGGPITVGLLALIRTVTGIQTRSTNFETIELVRSSFERWTRELSERRAKPVEFRLVDLYFDEIPDPAERNYLRNLPTSLALDDEAVDRLRTAGRELLRNSPGFRDALAGMARPSN